MLKIGLTGNIGSGKTTIARIFETLGIPVFFADEEGKKLLETSEVKQKIKFLFGEGIFDSGNINRQKLAKLVFDDKEKLEQLNAVIHPAVRKSFDEAAGKQSKQPYIIYEAAIMIESGAYKNLDRIILVTASEQIRLKRVIARDLTNREAVIKRMKNQWPEEKKKTYAHFIINNNQDQQLIPQVLIIHSQLLELVENSDNV
jgi:dephospho-CoA kinase